MELGHQSRDNIFSMHTSCTKWCISHSGSNANFQLLPTKIIEIGDFLFLFADSTEPPTFESVIDPLENARVPLYYSLYTGRQLGSGKAGRYFDAYKKVYSKRPRDCNSHMSECSIISQVLD